MKYGKPMPLCSSLILLKIVQKFFFISSPLLIFQEICPMFFLFGRPRELTFPKIGSMFVFS